MRLPFLRSLAVVPVMALFATGVGAAATTDVTVTTTTLDGRDVTDPTRTISGQHRQAIELEGTATGITTSAPAPSLIADAGDSSFVGLGDLVTLHGIANNADGDVTFAWSVAGDDSAFDDASLPSPSLDTSGFAAGDLVVTLATTDDTGTATDTVTLFLYEQVSAVLLDETQDTLVGLPEETADPSLGGLVDGESYDYDVTVPAGASNLRFTVGWSDDVNDYDMYVDTPAGPSGNTSAASSVNPETLTFADAAAGVWNAQVHAYLTTPDTFTVTATADVVPANPVPSVATGGPFAFEFGQPQTLTGSVTGGTAPYSFAWDTNLDGIADGEGDTITTAFPLGQHLVSFKVTDANGYEFREVTAVRVVVPGTVVDTASPVVIAVTDTGLNLYHRDWRAETYPNAAILELTNNFTRHPSEYLTGYPASAKALNITLGNEYFPAADQAAINAIEFGQLYWVPGTKIIGAIDDNSSYGATGDDQVKLLDEDGHGTASASVAVGNIYGWCPDCLLAVGEGFGNDATFNAAPWVDITSNSFGTIANVGFTPLIDSPPQTAAQAEAGQIAMYAAGNGAANAFVVPINTYVPGNLGADWIVRVGAAQRSSRKPIIGTGKPVDITSWGSGDIPSAEINTVSATGQHSGTSAATPYSAGALGDLLRRVRQTLGDTTNGYGGGVVANGTPVPGSPYLADGELSRAELLSAFYRTAEHDDGSNVSLFPTTTPNNPFQYLVEGYGIVEPRTSLNAFQVLLGNADMPVRTAEDDFYANFDEPIRDALWGDWNGGYASEGPGNGAGGAANSPLVNVASLIPMLQTDDVDATFGWMQANLGDFPAIAASVDDGGVSDVAYASITTPTEGQVFNASTEPFAIFGGDYGVPAGSVTAARHFLSSDFCSDNTATPEVEAENNQLTQSTVPSPQDACGYNPLAAALGPALGITETYSLPGSEAPVTLGAGQVSGSLFVGVDTPSPAMQFTVILSSPESGGVEVGRATVTGSSTLPNEVVEFPFTFAVNPDVVDIELNSLDYTIQYDQAQSQLRYRLNNPRSFVDLPFASEAPRVEVSLDGADFSETAFAGGTWTQVVDLTVLAEGAHTYAVRAVAGGVTTEADTVSFAVSNDAVTGGGASSGRVEFRVVRNDGYTEQDWAPVVDTSGEGTFATWAAIAPRTKSYSTRRYRVHTRVINGDDILAESRSAMFRIWEN